MIAVDWYICIATDELQCIGCKETIHDGEVLYNLETSDGLFGMDVCKNCFHQLDNFINKMREAK